MVDKRIIERLGVRLLVGFLFFAITCTGLWAQATAEISGRVTDQSGAVLPGVEVSVSQTDTGAALMLHLLQRHY